MSSASKVLCASEDRRAQALGSYVWDLIDKQSTTGVGMTKRKLAKQGHMYVRTSGLLGEFRVDVTHPEFDQVFMSRANR